MNRLNMPEQLLGIKPPDIPDYLSRHESEMIRTERPFTAYMRIKLREKGITQQNVFLAADIPERYGYKLISGEKRTVQRDVILRICLAAEFELVEVQEALLLYGMAPLYARIPRDCAFIVVFNNQIYDIYEVDFILRVNNLFPVLSRGQVSGSY